MRAFFTRERNLLHRTLIVALSALVSPPSQAENATADLDDSADMFFDEIVVTAQKREQSQQDVGIAITALSGAQLERLGYVNAQEVTAMAPGVSTIQPNGEANYAIGIRGVANSDFTTNVESPIAIYVDEIYVSQMSGAGFLLFDVERVEILRGPQGTLFGRNATGGLVHYVTKRPRPELGGYASLTYGSFGRLQASGAVNLPASETLMARLAVAVHQGGGYVENRLTPNEKLNNANDLGARLQLLFEPSDSVSLLLNARYAKQDIRTGFFEYQSAIFPDSTPTPGATNSNLGDYLDNDGDPYAGDYDFTGHNDLETKGISATLNWQISDITLTSITDYQAVTRDYIEDSDASPVDYFNFFLTTDVAQLSQELRLAGRSATLDWVAGFYYLNLDINDSNGIIATGWFEDFLPIAFGVTPAELGGTNGLLNPYSTHSDSWSLFAQASYQVTPRLTLTGGFRWIEEKKTHDYRSVLALFPETAMSGATASTTLIADGVPPYAGERNDGNWSARFQLDHKATDDLLLYISWNRGVKSGGFNAPLLPTDVFVTDQFMNYLPEKLDAFEAGFKWSSPSGRSRLNGAAYHYEYKNCQAFSIVGLDTFTLNADCSSNGFELELQASPVDGLETMLGIGFVDAKVKQIPGVTLDVDTPLGLVEAVAPGAVLRPVQTPKWNLNGLVRYDLPVGNGRLGVQFDAQYRSRHFFALVQTPASTEDGYTVANASVSWTPNDADWGLRLFVKNLTASKYLVQTFDLSGNIDNGGVFFGMIEQYYGRPRVWGINLHYDF